MIEDWNISMMDREKVHNKKVLFFCCLLIICNQTGLIYSAEMSKRKIVFFWGYRSHILTDALSELPVR